MQLYRGMDIGTAKVPPERAARHPAPPAGRARRDRDGHRRVLPAGRPAAIDDIRARGRTPILVGGSGLYIQAVVDEIDFPATDPVVRAGWRTSWTGSGIDDLFGLLDELDPAAAAAIGPANGRKIVRALEVIELTGRPFTATMPRPGRPRYGAVLLRLDRPTDAARPAAGGPGQAMVAAGFLDEVRALDAAGLRRGVTASRALGYAQLLAVLDGTCDLEQADRWPRGGHPAVRPPATVLVPPGPSDDRPGRRRAGPGRAGAGRGGQRRRRRLIGVNLAIPSRPAPVGRDARRAVRQGPWH